MKKHKKEFWIFAAMRRNLSSGKEATRNSFGRED
jgi:hypothetical protein